MFKDVNGRIGHVDVVKMTKIMKQARPGGRTEKNRQAVAETVLKLIGEGRLDFELQEVAALSGVHRTTIFRRWPDRGALMAEAMADHVARLSIELEGDWKTDLRHIAYGMRDFLSDPIEQAMNRVLAITDNQLFHEQMERHWEPILQKFRQPFLDAQARGELHEDVDPEVIISLLISAIVSRAVFMRMQFTDEELDRYLKQIIRAFG